MEKWVQITGLENFYEISNYGRIKSCKYGTIIKLSKDKDGYNRVGLRKSGKSYYYRVSRLVAIHFIPNSTDLQIVNHIDQDKNNDNADNLEWVNIRENTCFSIKFNKKLPIGVSQRKGWTKFRARITINRKSIHIGDFDTPEEASKAYIETLNNHNLKNKYAS